MIKNYFYLTLIAISIAACAPKEKVADNSKVQADAQKYLDNYNAEYQKLYYASAEGQWVLNTKIIEGDTTASHNAAIADEAYAKYTGSTANIDSAKNLLLKKINSLHYKQNNLKPFYLWRATILKLQVML